MKFDVNIYVETTWKGPARRKGVAMWLVEYKRAGESITRQGMIHLDDGTENQASLMAITAAAKILTKECSIRVFTQCDHILNTVGNFWHIQWQKNDWHNAKGKPVKNAELWQQMLEALGRHSYSFHSGHHEFQNVMQIEIRKEMEKK